MSSRTILVIDEDVGKRDSLADFLKHEGYTTISAGSSTEALEKIGGIDPGVAVLDVSSVNRERAKLVSDLHALCPDWICALLTDRADLDDALSAFEIGAYQCLQKPLSSAELLNQIKSLLEIARLRSEKQAAETRLFESEARFNMLFENTEDVIFIKDTDLRYTFVNTPATRYLGGERSALIGRTDAEIFGKRSLLATASRKAEKKVLAGRVLEEDIVSTEADTKRFYHIHRWPIRNATDAVCGVVSRIRDTTEKKILENKLVQAQKMEAMGVLSGGIAHDFNNILGAILGHVELALLGEKRGQPAGFHLVEVQKATGRASSLVKQILAFTRQENDHVDPVRVAPIVEECIQLIRAALPTTIVIEREIEDDACVVMANPTHLHQIIMNLAFRLRSGERELISTEDEVLRGAFVEISVKDDGCGMSDESVQNIFDPYFTTKQKGRGTGLGLAVVKDIVRRSGGALEVLTELGKGSEFRVFLPRIDTAMEERAPVDTPLPTGTECILYVDDEETLVEIGQNLFERLGYSVIGRTNPVEALAVFLEDPSKVDLVLTDQTMPQMTGVELAEAIRNERADIPILICSGFLETPDCKAASDIGTVDFLRKPIVLREFAETVRRALDTTKTS